MATRLTPTDVDRRAAAAAQEFLRQVTEELSIAARDGASLRVLSSDRKWFLGLAAYHPDRAVQAAMIQVMRATAEPAFSGLWRRVIDTGRPAAWRFPAGHVPEEAAASEAAFLRRFAVTGVLSAPVVQDGLVVGGVGLVRFAIEEDFSEDDRETLGKLAVQAAETFDFRDIADRLARFYR